MSAVRYYLIDVHTLMHIFLVFNYYNIENIFVVSINWSSIKIAITILKTLSNIYLNTIVIIVVVLLQLFVTYDHS